ncbi:MAG: DNA repair protein RadA, partial [bacterium]
MAKKKSVAYVCNDCGADYSKWQGQCSECHAWNTLSEVRLSLVGASSSRPSASGFAGAADGVVSVLADIDTKDVPRIGTAIG